MSRKEKDVILKEVMLEDRMKSKHDLTTFLVDFTYEETIFKQFPYGEIALFDSLDLPGMLPLIGEEKISAKFTTADPKTGVEHPPIEFNLHVHAMTNKAQAAESRKMQSYRLKYCSNLPFQNLNNVIFANFQNMKYSEMVQQIYDRHLKLEGEDYKPLNIEETVGAADFTVSGLSPVAAIKKILHRSVSESNGNFFVFYEDRDAYNFVTLGSMLKQDPVIKLTCQLKNIPDGKGSVDLARDLTNMSNYTRNNVFDTFSSALSGESSSSLLTVDPVVRRWRYNEFDLRKEDKKGQKYWDKFPKITHQVKDDSGQAVDVPVNKPWTDSHKMFVNPRSNMGFLMSELGQDAIDYISERTSVRTFVPEDFFLERLSQKSQLLKHVLFVDVSGDPRIKPGCIVEFEMPEIVGITGKDRPEEKDQWLQGKFLVIGVVHHVTGLKYQMRLEMVRDGFFNQITDKTYRDPKEIYKNYWNA
jgi:hypothetical protein